MIIIIQHRGIIHVNVRAATVDSVTPALQYKTHIQCIQCML